jgi:hypothetical protein
MRKRKRVKIDARDAYELAILLRIGSLPGAYIVPHEVRLPANAQQRCTFRRDKVRGCL